MPNGSALHRYIKATCGGLPRITVILALFLSTLAGFLVLSVTTASAADTVMTFSANAMTYTDSVSPKRNFGTKSYTVISKARYQSYVGFDTSKIPAGAKIVSASVTFRTAKSAAKLPGLQLRHVSPTWSTSSLTYQHRPALTSGVVSAGGEIVPKSNVDTTVKLADISAITPKSHVAFAVGYLHAATVVRISKSVVPVLRVTMKTAAPAAVLENPTKLPYVSPATGSTTPKVFAHYFPPYPISLDNKDSASDYYTKNYLNPDGEAGKFKDVGGLLRDRPYGRTPVSGDYQLADAMTEVRQASAAGIDGFTVNVMSLTGANWTRSLLMAKAAAQTDKSFVTIPNLDTNGSIAAASVETVAAKLAEFYESPSAYRLSDGRYVLSSFKAEGKPATWWKSVMTELKTKYGMDTAFIGVFLDLSQSRIDSYAPISYAMSIWGMRTPLSIMNSPDKAGLVHKKGVKWMAPIAVQDVRHHTLRYAEAENTATLRASWTRAIADHAEMVQLITWNDYSESTQFAPSEAHGDAFLDLNGYYSAKFQTGQAPALVGDEIIVSHRIQKFGTKPTVQTSTMDWTLSGTAVAPRDTVEVVTMLKLPASVTLKVGSSTTVFDAPAGVFSRTVPLAAGTVSATASRGGVVFRSVVSTHKVLSSVTRWDLQYYGATSRTG